MCGFVMVGVVCYLCWEHVWLIHGPHMRTPEQHQLHHITTNHNYVITNHTIPPTSQSQHRMPTKPHLACWKQVVWTIPLHITNKAANKAQTINQPYHHITTNTPCHQQTRLWLVVMRKQCPDVAVVAMVRLMAWLVGGDGVLMCGP